MDATTTDRDLLFGLMAARMDFLTADALAAGLDAWAAPGADGRPLAQVLVEAGLLDPFLRMLLEPLVEEHIRRHDGNPRQCIEALSSTPGLADIAATITDPSLRETLGSDLAAISARPGVDPTAGPESTQVGGPEPTIEFASGPVDLACPGLDPDPDPGRRGGPSKGPRFRILRHHRSGGLGKVYIARDEELGRVVALKEMSDFHVGDDGLRSRFVLEAEINGNLEHPGIVPVYGLGSYPDGRPYYAMRFVDGDSLAEAVARHHDPKRPDAERTPAALRLERRQLLGRFVDVCDAIAYAHHRGVLHRDLKPANVMLGKYGETLVVDWGLAKTLGLSDVGTSTDGVGDEPAVVPASSDSREATQAGRALGSIGYMSPEQALGRRDELGPATDVYSLGAILYCLLVGQAPIRGAATPETIAKIVGGEFPRPRELSPRLPLALEAVCLKALAVRPEDRYPNVAALAQDVECWLADEPVSAHPERWWTRAGRWARRHRSAVAGAGATLLAIAIGLGLGLYHVEAERARTEVERQRAENERERAEEGWQLARANEQTALEIARTMVDQAERQLATVPNTEKIRQALVAEALRGYRALLARSPADRQLRYDTARFHIFAGSIHRLLNQITDAEDDYRRAIELLRGLLDDRPDDTRARDRLAEVLRDLAGLERRRGHLGESDRLLGEALGHATRLRRQAPNYLLFTRTEAAARVDLNDTLAALGRVAEADANNDRAIELLQRLVATPNLEMARNDPLLLASALLNRAANRRELGRTDAALRAAEDQITFTRVRLAEQRNNNLQMLLALGLVERARTLLAQPGRRPEAEAELSKALALWEGLTADFPQIPHYREGHGRTLVLRGRVRADAGATDAAAADLDAGTGLLDDLATAWPAVPAYRAAWAEGRQAQGELALARGDRVAAGARLDEALAAFAEAARLAPEDARLHAARAAAEDARRRAGGG